ncbi:MAG: hypothetical protein WA160_02540 [Pseudobdellovibrio sp.]
MTEKDFGALYTCNKCQAAYFINFDGKPEFSNEEPSDLFLPDEDLLPMPEPILDEVSSSLANENQFFPAYDNSPIAEINSFADLNEFENKALSGFAEIASDISNFGNSETQISALNYDLKIIGLDTKEDLLAFKESIEDSRFGWDALDIIKQIKNGELFLQKLNPVQAYVLAKRIHFLDLETKWTQHALE